MGNVQTITQRVVNMVQNEAKNVTSSTQAIDQSQNINLDLTNTNCPNLSFINRAKAVSNLNIGSIAKQLAEDSMSLSDEQTQGLGLGFNANSTVDERTAIIGQKLQNSCTSEQTIRQTLNIRIVGANLSCEQLQALNDADLTTQCVIAAVLESVNNDAFKRASAQANDALSGIAGFLSTPIKILAIIILFIVGIILLFRLIRKPSATTPVETVSAAPAVVDIPVGPVDVGNAAATGGGSVISSPQFRGAMAQLFRGGRRR